jgi:hypothetical protein
MDPFYTAILGAIVRALLASLSGYLVSHHVLTAAQTERLTDDVVQHAMMAAPVVVAIAWSVLAKYRSRIRFLTALQAQPGTPEHVVDARISNGAGATLKSGIGLVVLLLCLPAAVHAQAIAIDKWTPALPTAGERRAADIASWGTVLTTLTLDGVATWKAHCEGTWDECEAALVKTGLRVGGTVLVSEIVKRAVHRARPCAPACGIDSPYSSTWSMHTALAFSALGGPRLAVALPLAIGTEGLRIAAGKHWLTDAVLGSVAGSLFSRIR